MSDDRGQMINYLIHLFFLQKKIFTYLFFIHSFIAFE